MNYNKIRNNFLKNCYNCVCTQKTNLFAKATFEYKQLIIIF